MAKQSTYSKDWKSTFEEGFALVKAESQAIMHDLGIEKDENTSWRDLPKMVRQFSKHNRTPLRFARNLDSATYDIRERVKWNTRMASRLALSKIKEKAHNSKASAKSNR